MRWTSKSRQNSGALTKRPEFAVCAIDEHTECWTFLMSSGMFE